METAPDKERRQSTRVFNSIKIKQGDKHHVIVDYTRFTLTEKLDELGNVIGEERNKEDIPYKADFLPHKSLLDAMKMLRKVVIQAMEFEDYKNFTNYKVIGIAISGEQDNAKVIITYTKSFEWTDDEVTNNTVAIPLYDNPEFTDSAKVDKWCAKIKEKALGYVDGEHGQSDQLQLEFEGSKGTYEVTDDKGNGKKEEVPAEQSPITEKDLPFGNDGQ